MLWGAGGFDKLSHKKLLQLSGTFVAEHFHLSLKSVSLASCTYLYIVRSMPGACARHARSLLKISLADPVYV